MNKTIKLYSSILTISLVLIGVQSRPAEADYLRPVIASEINKIFISGPSSVQAGKYVTVKLKTDKSVNGQCFLNSTSKGFANLSFYYAGKNKSVKLLPIQPGAGTISIECNSAGQARYGFLQLYIKK